VEFKKTMQLHKHELGLVILKHFGQMIRSTIGSIDYKNVLVHVCSEQDVNLGTRDNFTVVVVDCLGHLLPTHLETWR
jgi:hypothetical protein